MAIERKVNVTKILEDLDRAAGEAYLCDGTGKPITINRDRAKVSAIVAKRKLEAAAPDLIDALRQCVTEDGAFCMQADSPASQRDRLIHRISIINNVARAAIAKASA